MTTNEIKKLQDEHARYEKALHSFLYELSPSNPAYKAAYDALNPPPPPPVTLPALKAALLSHEIAYPKNAPYGIYFYDDESGSIRDKLDARVFSFSTLRDAVDFLNR